MGSPCRRALEGESHPDLTANEFLQVKPPMGSEVDAQQPLAANRVDADGPVGLAVQGRQNASRHGAAWPFGFELNEESVFLPYFR